MKAVSRAGEGQICRDEDILDRWWDVGRDTLRHIHDCIAPYVDFKLYLEAIEYRTQFGC